MSLDTLLKAAQYIELQEQSRSLELSPIASIGERYHRSQPQHQQHFYDSVSNSRNNARHHQVSSSPSSSSSSSPSSSSSSSSPPATAYVLSNGQIMHNNNNLSSSINNNNNNNISQLIHNDFDYGVEAVTNAVAATAVNGRSSEGRSITEEPYSNGHSSPSSFVMIKTPTPSTTITTNKHQQLHQQGQQSQEQQSLSTSNNNNNNNNNNCSPKNDMISNLFSNTNNNNTTITVVDKNKNSMLTNGHGNTSKMTSNINLSAFNGGVNLAALSAAAAAAAATTQPIVINVTNTRTAANTLFSANNANSNNNNHLISPHTIPTSTIGNSNSLRNSPPIMGVQAGTATATNLSSSSVFRKKCIPLTPPPMSNRKFIESSRIRSHSLSSNKIITANGLVGSNGFVTTNNINNNNNSSSSSSNNTTNININNINSNTPAILHNHHIHQVLAAAAEDSSQSSLNLSSSGYLSGSSINSNVGSINLSTSSSGGVPLNGVSMMNGSPPRGGSLLVSAVGGGHLEHPMTCIASSAPTSSGIVHQLHGGSIGGGSRRRTISSNSNGAGTREVHNKLEKHRRAQLKECFEQLKNQLQLKDEERKKTSNLSILGAALKHVMALKIKEQELEQQVELLAKEKINAQKKIVNLKRELGPKVDNIDFSSIISDIELGSIPIERVTEGLNDSISLSSGRGSMLYSSSSSLSSGSGGNTMSSPLGAGMQTSMPTALSPVISQQQQQQHQLQQSTTSSFSASSSSNNSSPISPNIMMKTSSPLSQSHSLSVTSPASSSSLVVTNLANTGNGGGSCSSAIATSITMPLSLTAKNISATSMTRGSPTPSTPSPSPSSSSGVSSSSSIHSSSPPIGGVKVVPNIPTTSCVKFGVATTTNGNTFVTSPVINIQHSENNGGISSSNSVYNATATSMPLNMNVAVVSSSPSSSSSASTSFPSFLSATTSSSPSVSTITAAKESNNNSGRNGLTRKMPSNGGDGHNNNNNFDSCFNNNQLHYQHQQQQQQILDEGEQPAKVFKVFNGLALGQMDKDSKLSLAGAPLQLSQVVGGGSLVVSPFMTSSPNGGSLRLVGPNSLATIELSSGPSSQSSSSSSSSSGRCANGQSLSPPNSGGAQLHKLLMSAVSASTVAGGGSTNTITNGSSSSFVSAAEVGRLPGGAELNILPTATNGTASLYRGNGKLSIVNNGISLKGADTNSSRGGVHVLNTQVLQSAAGLATIGVTQAQQNNNFAQLIATSPQMTGKVNLSVGGGQGLPLITGTQYLGSVKPVVVAVSSSTNNNNNNNNNINSNSNQPTLPSLSSVVVPPTSLTTSTAIVTGTTNGNAL